MERWALKRYVRRVSRKAYIKALDRFIEQYEKAYGCKARIELKLYKYPRAMQARVDDTPIEDKPTHRLPATKLLSAKMWREAFVVECIVTPAGEKQAPFDAMFASVQAKGAYPRQITFYTQGIGANAHSCALKANNQQNSGFADGNFNESFRCHHSRRF